MCAGHVKQYVGANGTYEWELPDFLSLTEKQVSKPFFAKGYTWKLVCFPKQNREPWKHVSLFIHWADASQTSHYRLPTADFTLTIVNHKNPERHFFRDTTHTFTSEKVDWGFPQMLPLTDVSVDSGYLRADGAMVIRVELKSVKRGSTSLDNQNNAARSVVADLLSDPGPTSDLTLTACGRSFPVHRAILAARCEFFKTLFGSGFDDSTSKQLPLPDAVPDALQLLLRYIYGGVLDSCPRDLLKPAAQLADRLRLPDARSELEDAILDSTDPETVVDDMLWAELHGTEKLSQSLQDHYLKEHAKNVDEGALATLIEQSPKLAAKLMMQLARQAIQWTCCPFRADTPHC